MKKFTALMLIIFTLIPILFAASCSSNKPYSEGDGKLNVVCTVFPPFDFARNVGKDKVTVTILQDNGADLHSFTPTASTLKALSQADVFICVGGVSDEIWLSDALKSANNENLKVIKLIDYTDGLLHAGLTNDENDESFHETGDHHEGHKHSGDEHVWTSIRNSKKAVAEIIKVFAECDSANAEFYKTNGNEYLAKLDASDKEYENAVNSAKRKTLVFADRFPFVYLMKDYGLTYYAAFSGCSSEIDASFETQAKLTEKVKNLEIPSVLIIDGSDGKLAKTVQSQTNCNILTVNSLQSVTRKQIQSGLTYLDILASNLETLKEALN